MASGHRNCFHFLKIFPIKNKKIKRQLPFFIFNPDVIKLIFSDLWDKFCSKISKFFVKLKLIFFAG